MNVSKASYDEGSCMECHIGTPVFKFEIGMFKARLCANCFNALIWEFRKQKEDLRVGRKKRRKKGE
jgi:hypothetical protein